MADSIQQLEPAGAGEEREEYRPRYLNFVLGMLILVTMCNFIDRQLMAILLEPIKAEFELSDTQMGFLTGFAFSIFYAVMGLPLAKLADQGNRKTLIAAAIGLWSLMTALCGLSIGFGTLLLARIGVAVGEAGSSPGVQSLISDYYPPKRRATVISMQMTGVYIGILFGFLLGGWLNEFFGWRLAFIVLGLPGVLFAGFFALTVKEPSRGRFEAVKDPGSAPPLAKSLPQLLRIPTYRSVILAASFGAFVAYGAMNWAPAFLMRTHGMSTGEIGGGLALSGGLGGGIGCLLGGFLADHVVERTGDQRWLMWLPGSATALSVPLFGIIYLAEQPVVALSALTVSSIIGGTWLGTSAAVIQGLAPLRMRALAFAVLLFCNSLIGHGMGPQIIGIMSDVLQGRFGVDSLRYALLICLTCGGIISVFFFFNAARTLRSDLQPLSRDA